MNKKHFYSHIVSPSSIEVELSKLDIKEDEKRHLLTIVESSIHITVMDTVMSNLSTEEKKEFLSHVHSKHHDKAWELAQSKLRNAEEKIKSAAEKVLEEFKKDIGRVKSEK